MSNVRRIYINTRTKQQYTQAKPTSIEVHYDKSGMITQTDIYGIITYASPSFRAQNGFSKEELIGMPHSIVRHPDMPDTVFQSMWESITQQKTWHGYIKNLCKDGSFYWALVYVQASIADNGEILGYVSSREVVRAHELEEKKQMYALLSKKRNI